MKPIEKRLARLEKAAASQQKLNKEIEQLLKLLGVCHFAPSVTGTTIVYDPQLTTGEAAVAALAPFLPDPGAVRCVPSSNE